MVGFIYLLAAGNIKTDLKALMTAFTGSVYQHNLTLKCKKCLSMYNDTYLKET